MTRREFPLVIAGATLFALSALTTFFVATIVVRRRTLKTTGPPYLALRV